jgi:hypothetical protein
VPCVSVLTCAMRSHRSASGSRGNAIPTGVTRIAAPLVSPPAPAGGDIRAVSERSQRPAVDGPSRSADPWPTMPRSQASSRSANTRGSTVPPPSTSVRARITACSVSSVTRRPACRR